MHECSDILDNYGGHPMAAGLSIKEQNLDSFRIRMNEYSNKVLIYSLSTAVLLGIIAFLTL